MILSWRKYCAGVIRAWWQVTRLNWANWYFLWNTWQTHSVRFLNDCVVLSDAFTKFCISMLHGTLGWYECRVEIHKIPCNACFYLFVPVKRLQVRWHSNVMPSNTSITLRVKYSLIIALVQNQSMFFRNINNFIHFFHLILACFKSIVTAFKMILLYIIVGAHLSHIPAGQTLSCHIMVIQIVHLHKQPAGTIM